MLSSGSFFCCPFWCVRVHRFPPRPRERRGFVFAVLPYVVLYTYPVQECSLAFSDSLYNMYGWFLPSPSVYRHAARGFPFPVSAFFLGVGRHGVGEPLVRRCRATPRSVESESSVRSVCGLSDGTSPCLGMPGQLHRTTCASND